MIHFDSIEVTTAPTVEPLTKEEAKTWCRIVLDDDSQDGIVESCIRSARERVEAETSRALLTQTLRVKLDTFPLATDANPDAAIILPRPPLQSVTSIVYTATDGTSTTLSASNYTVDTASEPGRITPAYGYTWPSTRDVPRAVTITYVAGWTATTLPEKVKQVCRYLVAHEYENREPVNIGNIVTPIPMAVETLMWQLRWGHYA